MRFDTESWFIRWNIENNNKARGDIIYKEDEIKWKEWLFKSF